MHTFGNKYLLANANVPTKQPYVLVGQFWRVFYVLGQRVSATESIG